MPVRYSDFILAALAEEMGFAGVFVALVLYTALLLRLIQNAQRAKDRAGMFLVMGVAAILGFHVLVNVAMVIGFMPVTGIPLPLMSYGGSATVVCIFGAGPGDERSPPAVRQLSTRHLSGSSDSGPRLRDSPQPPPKRNSL